MKSINTNKSQIATIVMVIIAVAFVFTLVSLNIGRVAQKKTIVDNVADGVGLQVASQLGSIASALKQELGIYGDDTKRLTYNVKLIVGGVLLLLAIITAGILSGGLVLIIAGAGLVAFVTGGSQQISAVQAQAQAMDALKTKFKNLDSFQRVVEMPVQAVLFALHEDTAMVKDTFDMDRDGYTDDYTPRFTKWYNLRLNALPQTGDYVKQFYSEGWSFLGVGAFFIDANGDNRFYIEEDENLMAAKGDDAVRCWVDSDGDNKRDLVLYDWFNENFRTTLATMREYGYGINYKATTGGFTIDDDTALYYEEGAIDIWLSDLKEFESTIVRNLHDMDFDTAVGGLDIWLPLLRDETGSYGDDWYTRLGVWQDRVDKLLLKLTERKSQIDSCVSDCQARRWRCNSSSTNSAGESCGTLSCEYKCCSYNDDGSCASHCYTKYRGCCGTPVKCGKLCDDSHCKPKQYCDTPLGGKRWCCDVATLEPACGTNIADEAITVLGKFSTDISQLRALIAQFYSDIKTMHAESYEKMHEVFYVWSGKVGKLSSDEQEVGHVVYVKTTGFDPSESSDNFKIPHPVTEVTWLPPKTGVSVENASGSFTLTAARFDESTSKTGPLSGFWKFKFSKGSISTADEESLHRIAKAFNTAIASNQSSKVDVDSLLSETDKATLRRILSNYGIASTVKVHYGPGYTYDPAKIKAGTVKADPTQRNKDIYIDSTSSSM